MSVYQRNGHWHLSITINGKRIRKAIKEARTRRQAEKAERILRDEIFENRYGIGGLKFFSDFVEKSYKPHAKEHKKGYCVEKSVLKVLLEKFGKFRLSEITTEDVERFKRQRSSEITRLKRKRSKATVNRDIAVLSAVFNLAKDFGEVKFNPVENVRYYTNLPSRERILSEIEERILFKKISNDVIFSQQVEILLYTGIRRGELFKLEWQDIDLKDGFINIRRETTKTDKPRIIPMLSNVEFIFQSLLNEAGEIQASQKIFEGIESRANEFSSRFRKICDGLGWNDLNVHSLRHTFSTRADKYKVGAFAQKALLGHSKLNMTDRYTHISKETLKESLINFEKFVKKNNTIQLK